MLLRKINAVLSLLSTILVFIHAILLGVWMITKGAVEKVNTPLPWLLMWVVIAHAIISIVLGILGHKNAEKRKCKEYPKLNLPTIMQRMSGICIIVFSALHILGAVGVLKPPALVHAILPPLFFTIVLSHVAVSTSKAFITLGIGSAKAVKIIDISVKVLCVATLLMDVIGFYLHSV